DESAGHAEQLSLGEGPQKTVRRKNHASPRRRQDGAADQSGCHGWKGIFAPRGLGARAGPCNFFQSLLPHMPVLAALYRTALRAVARQSWSDLVLLPVLG